MSQRIVLLFSLFVVLFASITVRADPHVPMHPDEYILQQDVTLSTGKVLPAGTVWYKAPGHRRLKEEMEQGHYRGDVRWAQNILYGRAIMYDTYYTVGEGRRDGLPPLAKGHIMNCTNCHAAEGTMPYAWPFFRTLTHFGLAENGDKGELFGNLGYYRDTRVRIRDCSRHCGGVVEIPPDSKEMEALVAWVTAVRDGIYEGEGILIPEFKTKADVDKIPGARVPVFSNIGQMKSDPKKGEALYEDQCASCHGSDGRGLWYEGRGYTIPPLSGEGALSSAGGPVMVPVGAAFLKFNMPLAHDHLMIEQEALEIMGYVSTMPRETVWWEPYYFRHNPCGRPAFLPKHIGTVPKGFPFSAEQTQFGPWQPIADWLKSDECKVANPVTKPLLKVDFDTRHPL